jgi:hypothetical protein
MLTFFSRLAAEDKMPAHERGPGAFARACAVLLAVAGAACRVAGCIAGAIWRGFTSPPITERSVPYGWPGGTWTTAPIGRVPWYWYRLVPVRGTRPTRELGGPGRASDNRGRMSRPVRVAQEALVQLARRVPGQFRHEVDAARALEVGDPVPAVVHQFLG